MSVFIIYMEQTLLPLDRNIQLDALIRTFESQPQGSMDLKNLELMASYLWQGEQKQLLQQLLDDGFICYGVGPEGLDMNLTKAGYAWIAGGGYSRNSLTGANMPMDVRKLQRKILVHWLIGVFYLLLLAWLCLS
jgi:hypothetical protein